MNDDARDEVLADRFAAAVPDVDPTARLDALAPRFEAARRRRRQMLASGAGAVAVVALVVGVGLRDGSPTEVSVAGPGRSTDTTAATSTVPTSSSTTVPAGSATTTPGATAPTTPGPTTTTPSTVPATAPTTAPSRPTTTRPTTTTTRPGVTPSSPTSTIAVVPERRTTSVVGGRVVIDVASRLTLVSATPAEGFGMRVAHQEADRIEVRFESPTHESRVELRLEGGVVTPRIEERPR